MHEAIRIIAEQIEVLKAWKNHPEYDRERSFEEVIGSLQQALDKLCEEKK